MGFPGGDKVEIIIDDAKTSTADIVEALKSGGYSAKQPIGEPPEEK
ncbi:MAG: hypothetical protein ACYC6Q_07120 [Syntrophales bacterium]